jgi:hypothetical protein
VEDVAGYRVLRSAGHGDRARLLLGFADGRTVVLKVTPVGDPGAATEIDALHRAAGEHVVALEDVSVDERQTVLVLERLPNGTLAELLERRGGLDAGEAVTILAPIATTVDRMHAAGVAHGRLSPVAICFRDDGAPTLTGFGQACLFAADSPEVVLETEPGVLADRASLGAVAALVLARVVGTRAAAARSLAMLLPDTAPADLDTLLFDVAAPAPVRFDVDDADVVAPRLGDPRELESVEDEPRGALPPWVTNLLPEWLAERIAEPTARLSMLWSRWDPRRRRLALGALAGGLTVLVAVAAVPASTDRPQEAQATTEPPPAAVAEPVLPDDPVAAAILLLDLRDRCVRDLSLLCLDRVVQPDSAAQVDDMALIRGIQTGGEVPDAGVLDGEPVLVERLGDAALLDLPPGSVPTSLLLMRTTNGWRIRDYLDAPAVGPQAGEAVPG